MMRRPGQVRCGTLEGQRVLYVQYSDPAAYPPLEHSARLLADAGCEVLLVGIDLFRGRLAATSGTRIETRIMPATRPGWRQKVHYLRFVWRAVWTVHRWRPTWVYASDPLSCVPAWMASWLGARVIYHEHDSPEVNAELSASVFSRIVLRARDHLARRASVCILPNEHRAADFAERTQRRDTLTVWNCPTRAEIAGRRRSGESGPVRLLYHGSIVPARLPTSVLRALAQTGGEVTLVVAGYETVGSAGYLEELRAVAAETGVGDRVEFVGTVPTRAQLLELCGTCDVGLALMPSSSDLYNERTMTGASNKAFDYLANGLALLVSERAEWREMFVDPGYGLACVPESPASIARALTWFVEHAEARRHMGEIGRQQVEQAWNYETVFAPVLRHMTGQLERSESAPSEARAAL